MFLESWNCHGKVENIARKYSWLQFIFFDYVINFCNISPNHKKKLYNGKSHVSALCGSTCYKTVNSTAYHWVQSSLLLIVRSSCRQWWEQSPVSLSLCVCVFVFACSVSVSYSTNIEMNILSFQRNFRYWLYRRLSFRKLSVQLVMKISSMCVVALNGQ